MEIDFLITEGKKIAPVEVKSNNYTSHSSLDKFRNKFSSKIGNSYVLYSKNIMIKDGIIHLPFYMAMFLQAAPAEVFSAGIFFVYCSPNFEERQKYADG